MPAVFDLALYGTLQARPPAIDRLSLGTAIVLIVAYAGSLIYAFTAQRDLFRPSHAGARRHAGLTDGDGGRGARGRHGADDDSGGVPGRRAGAGARAVRVHRAVRRRRSSSRSSATPPSTTPRSPRRAATR